jgi:uncharacterized membrane protein
MTIKVTNLIYQFLLVWGTFLVVSALSSKARQSRKHALQGNQTDLILIRTNITLTS